MASSPSQTLPGTQARRTGKLKKISLIPFVAVLYAYCAGGPFDYEAMVSTSGPGMALLFTLIVPGYSACHGSGFSGNGNGDAGGRRFLSLDSCSIWRFLGFPMRLVELDWDILHVGLVWSGAGGLRRAGHSGAQPTRALGDRRYISGAGRGLEHSRNSRGR